MVEPICNTSTKIFLVVLGVLMVIGSFLTVKELSGEEYATQITRSQLEYMQKQCGGTEQVSSVLVYVNDVRFYCNDFSKHSLPSKLM